MRPRVRVRAGPGSPALPVTALRLRRALAWPVGRADIVLPPGVDPPDPGAAIAIAVAEGDGGEQPLMSGDVVWQQTTRAGVRLLAEEPSGRLARLRVDRSWSATSADRVIRELLGLGQVAAGTLEPGATLPAVAVLHERTVLDHVLHLARLSGLVAWCDARGLFHARQPLPVPGPLLLGPQHAIGAFDPEASGASAPDAQVTGEGALGSHGPGAEAWLLQDPAPMRAGPADAAVRHASGCLKTVADVQRLQRCETARLAEHERGATVTLLQTDAVADLGDVVTLAGFGRGDGPSRVVALDVAFDGRSGYVARWRLQGVAA